MSDNHSTHDNNKTRGPSVNTLLVITTAASVIACCLAAACLWKISNDFLDHPTYLQVSGLVNKVAELKESAHLDEIASNKLSADILDEIKKLQKQSPTLEQIKGEFNAAKPDPVVFAKTIWNDSEAKSLPLAVWKQAVKGFELDNGRSVGFLGRSGEKLEFAIEEKTTASSTTTP